MPRAGQSPPPPWWWHLPFLHCSPLLPQLAPSLTGLPVSVHAGTPPLHETAPTSHGFAGVQLPPAAQATQAPPLHAPPLHGVPSATEAPVSPHVELPDEQDVAPTWQLLVGAHATPAVHAWHVPLEHAPPPPHDAPMGAFVPLSTQTAWPELHDVAPP